MRRVWLAFLLAGCATGTPVGGRSVLTSSNYRPFTAPGAPRKVPAAESFQAASLPPNARDRVVTVVRSLVGKPKVVVEGKRYPDDCTSLVRAAFDALGVDVMADARSGDNGVTAIYRWAASRGRIYEGGWPVAGDLVFFRETYDQNRDGRPNDGLTHVGIVERVEPDGTVLVVHRVARGVVRYRMNLGRRNEHKDRFTGATLNDYLRTPHPAYKDVLTGQLFAAFATVLPVDERVASR